MANYRLGSPIIVDTFTSSGTLALDTSGAFALNIGQTNAVSIGLGHSGMITTSLGGFTVNQDALFLGSNFTVASGVINFGDANTDIINTLAAFNTDVPFGQIGSTGTFKIYALQQSAALSTGSNITFTSGRGGNATVSNNGGIGGATTLSSSTGGDGYTGHAAGAGGLLTIKAGDAGALNGGTGNNGGDLSIDAGNKTGSGTEGLINIGASYASSVHVGRAGKTTFIDGYLKVDGYVNLSHDVGYVDSLALTQSANTTTGGDLRVRHLRFFSDNVPSNQAPQTIYATGGDLVLSSPSQNIMIDAAQMYWSQNANIYSGGFTLQVGPFHNYIKMSDSITNTVPGYDFVGTGSGGSVGANYGIRETFTNTYTASGVNFIANQFNIVNNTNDAYSGSTVGLVVDVSGGTNTSFPKTAAKFIGGPIEIDGYKVDLTSNIYDGYSLTYSLNSNKFSPTSSVIYWDGYTTWAQVYNRLLNSINEYDTTPVVIVDGSYTQEIPAGTYDANALGNAYFTTPGIGQSRINIDSGVTFTGSNFLLVAQNILFVAHDTIVSSGTAVTLLFSGYAGLSNAHATHVVFPQVPDGSHIDITGGSLDSRPSADDMSVFATSGGVIFDLASGAVLGIDITNSPGGLTGTNGNAVIGGAGTVTVHGDGMSIAGLRSTDLTGTTTFASGNPKAYATVLAHFTTGGLPSPTNLPDGYMVLDTTVPAIAVAISGAWKKTTLS